MPRPHDPKAKTVGSALFGDGCAAVAALQAIPDDRRPGDPRLTGPSDRRHARRRQPRPRRARTATCISRASCPTSPAPACRESSTASCAANGLERSDIDHWIVHPGGRRIIENVQSALELSREDVATSWGALAEHGNVGTPSIFYVLKDTIERCEPEPGERGLMVTIGPGVTVGLMLLGW